MGHGFHSYTKKSLRIAGLILFKSLSNTKLFDFGKSLQFDIFATIKVIRIALHAEVSIVMGVAPSYHPWIFHGFSEIILRAWGPHQDEPFPTASTLAGIMFLVLMMIEATATGEVFFRNFGILSGIFHGS